MDQFELPLIDEEASVEDAFEPMIRKNVSGIVIKGRRGFHLLHYMEIHRAWRSNIQRISEIPAQLPLEDLKDANLRDDAPQPQYWLAGSKPIVEPGDFKSITVFSQRESGALMYRVRSSGFCCTGPAMHCYPPLRPGPDKRCVAVPCPGTIP